MQSEALIRNEYSRLLNARDETINDPTRVDITYTEEDVYNLIIEHYETILEVDAKVDWTDYEHEIVSTDSY